MYRFSWTTEAVVARKYAESPLAPPEVIMPIWPPENYYDVGEVIVDPFWLGKIKVVERLVGDRVGKPALADPG